MNSFVNKKDIIHRLAFLAGFFSTFQIVEVFGVSLFSYVLIVLALIGITKKKAKIASCLLTYFLVVAVLSEIMCFNIKLNNAHDWQVASMKSFILLVAVFLTSSLLIRDNSLSVQFLKGLKISCHIQVFWCYLQLFFSLVAGISINKYLFTDILHMGGGYTGQVNLSGALTVTGLNTNTGILTPTLVIGLLVFKSPFLKALTFILFFVSGNSSMFVCGLLIVFAYCIANKGNFKTKISLKSGISLFSVIMLVVFVVSLNDTIRNRVVDIFTTLVGRLETVQSGKYNEGSTFVHVRYYTSLPYIFSQEGIWHVLFGYGMSCAGVPFVAYCNQYSNLIYVPESDPITFIYNNGIIGFGLFYAFLSICMIKGWKVDRKYAIFFFVLITVGFLYGIQVNWVILLELIFAYAIKKGYSFDFLFGESLKNNSYRKSDSSVMRVIQ